MFADISSSSLKPQGSTFKLDLQFTEPWKGKSIQYLGNQKCLSENDSLIAAVAASSKFFPSHSAQSLILVKDSLKDDLGCT